MIKDYVCPSNDTCTFHQDASRSVQFSGCICMLGVVYICLFELLYSIYMLELYHGGAWFMVYKSGAVSIEHEGVA